MCIVKDRQTCLQVALSLSKEKEKFGLIILFPRLTRSPQPEDRKVERNLK